MSFLKQVMSDFSADRCPTLAAALAYYTAFALPPLLYLLWLLLTLLMTVIYPGEEARVRAEKVLLSNAAQLIGNPAASDELQTMLENSQQQEGTWWRAIVSLAGVILGATGVMAALQDALNQVWEVQVDPRKSGFKQVVLKRILSFAMILGLGFLLVVSLAVSSVLSAIGDWMLHWAQISGGTAEAINWGVQTVVLFTVFSALFRFMPDAVVQWRDVLAGATITTILFVIGRYAMQIYFGLSSPGAQLGAAAASLVVLLVWVYYSAVIVLIGAEATQVWATRFGNGIQPEANAVRVVPTIQRGDTSSKHSTTD